MRAYYLIDMTDDIPFQLATIAFFAIAAQWIGWRLKIPAIVFLLISGLLAGPIFGLITPEPLFGDLLQPAISLAVGLILFEGSLNLNFKEIRGARHAIRHFVIVGAPVAWALTAAACHYLAGLSWPVSLTFGGLLIVTGPTVIMPLLKHARLNERVGSILKWEGIVNDPIGAIIAVLCYEFIVFSQNGADPSITSFTIHAGSSLLLVSIMSAVAGYLLAQIMNRGWIAEYLKPAFIMSSVIILFVGCNMLLHESGLIGVTILGMVLANLSVTSIEEIKRFKETISIVLVSGIFVVITAGMDFSILSNIDWRGIAFILSIIFVIRPLVAFASSIGSKMTWRETVMTGWIAPRGIVCVAVAGVMGPLMVAAGYEDGEQILPLAFAIVLSTVFIGGLTAKPLGRMLGLAHPSTDGLIIVGASEWSIQFGETLAAHDIAVSIADRNWHALKPVRLSGSPIKAYYGEPLSEETGFKLELTRYNKLLAATDNAEYNALLCSTFAHEFGKERVFQLSAQDEDEHERKQITHTIKGQTFAAEDYNYWDFSRLYRQGWRFKTTRVDAEFNLEDIQEEKQKGLLVIVGIIKTGGKVQFQPPQKQDLKDGDTVIVFERHDEIREPNTTQHPDLPDDK
ncbi:MAG: sodium:proton exchanger [Micavibrio sp.]|nr:sodium:proton exchanger [Micavibrio sp.]